MPTLSDTILLVTLPSGNRAVYAVQPQHINLQHWGATLNQVAIEHGRQLAVCIGGDWFKPGAQEPITDHRTIALLERSPES